MTPFGSILLKDVDRVEITTLIESKSPTLIAQGTIAVTGKVERTTNFEQGMPNAYVQVDGHPQKYLIADDQSLIVQLKNERLVLITGCCHAGIINTIRFARQVTGIDKVYGVLEGLRLSGAFFEAVIDKTVADLKKFDRKLSSPCTAPDGTL
jgi:7,8-dihydropterin-6-yl-methyl-4-(beta-D-ribofuranosyl)aminobenzene 5'-phosphate synthase